ncbi:TPA: nucleotide-binding protein [Candidatus Poribacteria bacterium]|nr:nucleotide-binding protein [Candidatus Poribacteria bacterium]
MLEELKLFGPSSKAGKVQKTDVKLSKQIFLVHGHDDAMKQAVARTLEKIGLEPIILHEKPSEGRTIIEKFTDYSEVSFAVVLLSPDDIAYPKDRSPKDAMLRARQNVIFELGFFIGKLGRNRVLVLYQEEENFEMPSDYSGVLYTPYDSSGRWQFDLIKELKACGYDVDANKLL